LNYNKLLKTIIIQFFKNYDFDLKGKLDWYPLTKQQKSRSLKKTGMELKVQRTRYKSNEIFWEKPKREEKSTSPYFFYHHILISNLEQNGIFYCIVDHCMGRMGQKTRYKFKVLNYSDSKNISDYQIDLLNKEMIMVR